MTPFLYRISGILLLSLLTGCGGPQASTTSGRPFEGQTVPVVVPAGLGYRESWEPAINDWSAQTGAKVTLREVDLSQTPLTTAAEPGSLVVFPLVQMAESSAGLSPLPTVSRSPEDPGGPEAPQALSGLGWDEIWLGLRDKVAAPSKSAAMIPICVPVPVLYYREDLLAKANLTPPKTWDQYADLVRKMPEWAPGKILAEPWGEEFRATMFLARAVSAAQHPGHRAAFFDTETGSPLIHTPPYERSLAETVAILKELSAESRTFCLKASPSDCRAEILSGRAALAIAWEPGPHATRTPMTPGTAAARDPVRADGITIGVARLPGSKETYNPSRGEWETGQTVTLTGFGGLLAGVRAGGSEKGTAAAWDLAGRLWNVEAPSPQPAGTALPFREGDLGDVSRFAGPGLESGEVQAYVAAVAESLRDRRLVVELPVAGRDQYRSALAKGLGRALAGEQTPAEALKGVAVEWRRITESIGSDRLRESYRRSLGL